MKLEGGSVSGLWIGGELGQFERLSLSTFVTRGFEVNLFSYDPGLVPPRGVLLRDADDIAKKETVFENFDKPGTFAAFSNIFRYLLLRSQDTTWIDVDVVALKDSLPAGDYLFGWESRDFLNGAVLRAPGNSPIVKFWIDSATSIPANQVKWGQLGPRLISKGVREFGLENYALPREILYPVPYHQVWKLFDPRQLPWVMRTLKGSSTLHLWNEALRTGPAKLLRPPKGSYLDFLFESHEVEPDSEERLSLDWVRRVWRPRIDPRPFETGFLHRRAPRLLQIARPSRLRSTGRQEE